MKARILGACATVQAKFHVHVSLLHKLASIVPTNDLQTCGRPDTTVVTLITKVVNTNRLKNIAGRQRTYIPCYHPRFNHSTLTKNSLSLSYVMPSSLIGIGTRSPVMVRNYELKGAHYFARKFSTEGQFGSSENVISELEKLRLASEKNDIDKVNSIVKGLMGNTNF